jgi:hypothetical protein
MTLLLPLPVRAQSTSCPCEAGDTKAGAAGQAPPDADDQWLRLQGEGMR